MAKMPEIAAHLTRRRTLTLLGALGTGGFMGCERGAEGGPDALGGEGPDDALGDAGFDDPPASCTVYPQQVEGPYYVSGDLLREDITEGAAGTPLTLNLRLVQEGSCQPLGGVAVDVWQCDALGIYSGFPNQLQGLDTRGKSFLRGTQISNARGEVVFRTIYPGWYPGRTTHIHFKVRPTAHTAATSQLYFPEPLNEHVYTNTAPYATRGNKDTTNAEDGANRARGVPPLPKVESLGDGFVARFVIAVAT